MMKRVLISILFLTLFGFSARSQSQYWLGFGYNMSRFKMDNSLNFVIDRYNSTRTANLTKEMKNIHFADGLAFSFGFNFNRVVFDLGYTGKKQTVYAQGNYTAGTAQRDLRFKNKCYSMGLGVALLNSQTSSVSLCATIDLIKIKTETRSGEIPSIDDEEYYTITDDLDLGTTFYLQFLLGSKRGKGLALIARPYYQFSYLDTDFYEVNATINPTTYSIDPDIIASKTSNIGLSMILAIYGSN